MPSSRPTHLILIRHGETPWTRERRYQGRSDTSLTAQGIRQSKKAAKKLRTFGIQVLYSSSLKRARQTAGVISKMTRLPLRIDPRLNELSFGRWEGVRAVDLLKRKDPVFLQWSRGRIVTPPGGESLRHLRLRVSKFLKECLRRHKGKTVALVSHGGPIKVFIFTALGLPLRSLWSLRIDPASMSVLTFCPHFTQLGRLNVPVD